MGKWKESQLRSLCKIIGGGTPSKANKEFYNGQIPWATVRDMKSEIIEETEFKITEAAVENSSTNIIKKGSIIIATRVGLGKVCFAGTDIAINQDLKGIIVNDSINKRYLFYYFKSIEQFLTESGTGATVKGVKLDLVKNLKIPLPPLPEQKYIVAKLDSLFEKIDRAIGLLEENIAHTEALMGSVLDGIFDKVSQNYKTSPLLKHVDFVGGSQPPKSSFSYEKKEGYVRLIQIRDYKSDKHVVYIKEDSTKKFCEEDDVMIGRYGPPVFQILRGIKGAYNVALMKAIPDEEVILKDYLYYFLMNGKIQNYIISISQRSAGQSGVNKKALEAYEIAIPPLEVQKKIVVTIKAAIPKVNKTQKLTNQNLENLKVLKSSLLDRAFKGEL